MIKTALIGVAIEAIKRKINPTSEEGKKNLKQKSTKVAGAAGAAALLPFGMDAEALAAIGMGDPVVAAAIQIVLGLVALYNYFKDDKEKKSG